MVGVALVASVRPSGRTESLTKPSIAWANRTSEWTLPGRFAFFVFKIDLPFDVTEWLPGVDLQWEGEISSDSLFAGATVAIWSEVCYTSLRKELLTPHPVCKMLRQIRDTIERHEYEMRGEKTTQAPKYFLQ